MAIIIPRDVEFFNHSFGEREIYNSLLKLNDDYIIFYSLMWNRRDNHNQIRWGEADFVIFNPNYGMLVVEVKSGGIILENGKWYQRRMDNHQVNEMQNPFKQADRSKFFLIDNLSYLGRDKYVPVDKIVWFPSVERIEGDVTLPPYCSEEIIFTRDDLGNPDLSIINAFEFYNFRNRIKFGDEDLSKTLELLAPEFNLIPTNGYRNFDERFQYLRLTQQQNAVIQYCLSVKTACIEGMAGTGKTIAALELARNKSCNGKNVLYLCFNNMLADFLKRNYESTTITIRSVYGFAANYTDRQLDSDVIVYVLEKNKKTILNQYDYCIIDEAQDFTLQILEQLNSMFKESGIFFFYDENQMLYQNEHNWFKEQRCNLMLNQNCRNSVEIAKTSINVIKQNNANYRLGYHGTKPQFIFSSNVNNKLSELVNSLISDGIHEKDISILTMKTEEKSFLYGIQKISERELTDDMFSDKVLFTTSRKFKGLESEVIIIIDPTIDDFTVKEKINNLYVAMSRAKKQLFVLFNVLECTVEELAALNENMKGFSSKGIVSTTYQVELKN